LLAAAHRLPGFSICHALHRLLLSSTTHFACQALAPSHSQTCEYACICACPCMCAPPPQTGGCYLYGRSYSPTVQQLARQLAAMEDTQAAYAVASGVCAMEGGVLGVQPVGVVCLHAAVKRVGVHGVPGDVWLAGCGRLRGCCCSVAMGLVFWVMLFWCMQ
jgi:hypothetical protein